MKFLIIGPARSGTTVLQNALNACPAVYLLGEANLYRESNDPGFRSRYNRMHATYGNQISKSTYAPDLGLPAESSGHDYLCALEARYAVAGDKLALGPEAWGHDYSRLRGWVEINMPICLFVFRRPADVMASSAKMFSQFDAAVHVESYASVVAAFLDLARSMPKILCVIHERIKPTTFEHVGEALGVDLGDAFKLYDFSRARTKHAAWPSHCEPYADQLDQLYQGVGDLLGSDLVIEPRLLQAEQKTADSPDNNRVGALRNLAAALNQRVAVQLAEEAQRLEPSSERSS